VQEGRNYEFAEGRFLPKGKKALRSKNKSLPLLHQKIYDLNKLAVQEGAGGVFN